MRKLKSDLIFVSIILFGDFIFTILMFLFLLNTILRLFIFFSGRKKVLEHFTNLEHIIFQLIDGYQIRLEQNSHFVPNARESHNACLFIWHILTIINSVAALIIETLEAIESFEKLF